MLNTKILIYNPDFNRTEFHTVRNESGRIVLTAKQWIERMNADMIREGIPMSERLKKLRRVAYYLVDGEEYPCIFPKEAILENKLYSTEKTYTVWLNAKTKKVFDPYATTTCILGLLFSIGCFAVIVMFLLQK